MAYLISIPVLLVSLLLQVVVVNRLPLANGVADLILVVLLSWGIQVNSRNSWIWAVVGGLMVSFVSGMPYYAPLFGYLLLIFGINLVQRRVWQTPILVLFIAVVAGTFIQHAVNFVVLFISGVSLPLQETITSITLPSALLNLLASLPVYLLVSDLNRLVYPVEVD